MSLGTKLVQSARKEATLQRPFPLRAEAVEALPKGGELRAIALVADNDRFTKLTSEVTVSVQSASSTNKASGRAPSVRERAEKFAAKTTYLTEALAFVETDVGGTAIVRSTPATMTGRGEPYFEAAVTDDAITLRRFQATQGGARESQPFCLTDDVLARLVEDASATLAPRK